MLAAGRQFGVSQFFSNGAGGSWGAPGATCPHPTRGICLCVPSGFVGSCWVLLGFFGFCWFLLGPLGLCWVFWVLLGFLGSCWVLLGFLGPVGFC